MARPRAVAVPAPDLIRSRASTVSTEMRTNAGHPESRDVAKAALLQQRQFGSVTRCRVGSGVRIRIRIGVNRIRACRLCLCKHGSNDSCLFFRYVLCRFQAGFLCLFSLYPHGRP